MLKQLKRKKKKTAPVFTTTETPVVCAACNYVRKPTDTNPDWECPCCLKVYAKVNADIEASRNFSQEDFDKKLRRDNWRRKKKEILGSSAALAGVFTFISGAASTCSGAAANPWLKAAGVIVIIGSLFYGLLD